MHTFVHDRPCDRRKRAKLNRKTAQARRADTINLISRMHMRCDIQRKRRAFLIRNAHRAFLIHSGE